MIYLLASSASSGTTFLRSILFGINEGIFKFIANLYDFMKTLAEEGNNIILTTDIGDYTTKIYAFIGIVMLFRIAIILLRYIADPDKTMDKGGSGSKIIPHVIVVLVLLVMTPTMFSWLYRLQTEIFSSGLLTNIFTSTNTETIITNNILYKESSTTAKTCTYKHIPKTHCFTFDNLKTGYYMTSVNEWGSVKYTTDYNFCPATVVVTKSTTNVAGKIVLYSTSNKSVELKKSSLSGSALSTYNTLIDEDSECNDGDTSAISLILPYELSGTTINVVHQTGKSISTELALECDSGGLFGFNAPFPCTNEKLIFKRVSCQGTKYNANYYLEVDGKNTCNVDGVSYKATGDIDVKTYSSLVESLEKGSRTGSKFVDIIMMSFITENITQEDDATNYTAWTTEKEKLNKSETEYSVEENQIDYSVIADLIRLKDDNKKYEFEYSGFISLIAALVVLVMLVATIFKVAIRLFKLMLLEIIAPIPIIMYLDPNSKSGQNPLSNWAHAVMNTYIDVFIRVLVIEFVAMVIANLNQYLPNQDDIMLRIFLIFGGLMFLNVGPEFILGLFGKKYEPGGFNPFKQMSQVAGLGIATGAIGGGFKGLTQGGIKGLAVGTALGAKGAMGAGDKGKGMAGFGAGRDFVGKSLSEGSNETGGIIQRAMQETAAKSLRANTNQLFASANSFKKGQLTASKEAFKAADSGYTTSKENLADARARLSSATMNSQMYRDQARLFASSGKSDEMRAATAEADRYMSEAQKYTVEVKARENDFVTAEAIRENAVTKYNEDITAFNKLYDAYDAGITNDNKRTGKASNQYDQEQMAKDFKRGEKVV